MKNALNHVTAIRTLIQKKDCVILLDFDGTLVPLQRDFSAPRLSARTKRLLTNLAREYPLAIISGRALGDIKNRVHLPGVSYGGCHGIEWQIENAREHAPIQDSVLQSFHAARRALARIAKTHGAKIERKTFSCALHYRALPPAACRALIREAQRAVRTAGTGNLRVLHGEKAFDVMPKTRATKGTCARMLFNALRRSRGALPVYIGDGTTDEDAFRAFKNGITIRVGDKRGSAAHYFVAGRSDVDSFLLRLVQ